MTAGLWALLMLLCLAACGAKGTEPAFSPEPAPSAEPETVEIPLVSPEAEPDVSPEPAPDTEPEPTPEPPLAATDPAELPDSLIEFLCRFDDGYTDRAGGRDFDSANAVDVRANLLAQIVCALPCVDFSRYPVEPPVYHWGDGSIDPQNWAGAAGCYAEFDPASVRWVAQNVFRLSEGDTEAVLERCFYSGAFYEGQNADGKDRFFLPVRYENAPNSLIRVESAQSNGTRYELVYDYLLRPREYVGSYEASLELKQGENGSYWSLSRQTAHISVEESADDPELFARLTEPFIFSDGLDVWRTELTIAPDGSFSGFYEDYGITENGEDYDQTVYYADFEGRLVHPKRLNAFTWSAELESLNYPDYTMDYIVEEEDGWRILYRYADAVGLENCKTVYFYASGAPVYRLPESFISWYVCIRPLEDSDLALPGWGMMNGEDGQGFAS